MHAQAFQHLALIGKYLPPPVAAGANVAATSSGAAPAPASAPAPSVTLLTHALQRVAQCIVAAGSRLSIEKQIAQYTGLDQDYPTLAIADMAQQCDVAVVVGGDGTMLGVARQLAGSGLPLIGINQGRLGFMTDIALDQVEHLLPPMLRGACIQDQRHLLHAQVLKQGAQVFESLALNDVTINRESTSGMIELRVEVDNHFVCNQRADGLILSTATGSTAYALSAGGPLLHPEVGGWVLVPIAPHTLSNRPIVLSKHSQVHIQIVNPRAATANFDAQTHYAPLQQGDSVLIRRAEQAVCFLHPTHWNYFDTLREKLHWNKGSA
ncbi:MAG: NAD kinase [Brachymonas sp.]|nr:NAD kinase [Brachymonas sp.]